MGSSKPNPDNFEVKVCGLEVALSGVRDLLAALPFTFEFHLHSTPVAGMVKPKPRETNKKEGVSDGLP